MIRIRANRDWKFIELHIKGASSVANCQYVTINDLDGLINTLQEVQRFLRRTEESIQNWEIS